MRRPTPSWSSTRRGVIRIVNRQVETLFGYGQGELIGRVGPLVTDSAPDDARVEEVATVALDDDNRVTVSVDQLRADARDEPEYMRLDDDDGISGVVVSRMFKGMSTLDRQGRIEEVLQKISLVKEPQP